jgi:hypothetical protein
MTISEKLERMARDVTSGPGLVPMLEIAVVGAVVGGAVGYAKERDKSGAKTGALWGLGLGVAGQYLLFQMLRPVRSAAAAPRAMPPRPAAPHLRPRFAAHGDMAGWGHGEMMGAVPWPHYWAWWE